MSIDQLVNLDAKFFEATLHDKLDIELKERINKKGFTVRYANREEEQYCIKAAIESLISESLEKAGSHRLNKWEDGWSENLVELISSNTKTALVPKYWGKNKYSRLNKNFIIGNGTNLIEPYDNEILGIIMYWLFGKYISPKNIQNVYEFGCGTGQHLIKAAEVNNQANIYGLDWAQSSQEIINNLNNNRINGMNFDFFSPDYKITLGEKSAVYTVTSLEQIGENYKDFVDYLLINKPEICFHVEPIAELLDENNLIDYLSIKYFEKRNYLKGFLTYLEGLEACGKIEILQKQRTMFGNMFVDGWSVIAWRCKP